MTGHLDRAQLEEMKRNDLVALAKDLGVSASGKSAEIIDRILAEEVEAPDESELTEEDKAAIAEAEKEDAEKQAAAEQASKQDKAAGKGVAVRVTLTYLDKHFEVLKYPGDVFTVSKERADELIAAKVAELAK